MAREQLLSPRQNNFYFLLMALLVLLLTLPVITDIYGPKKLFLGHISFSLTLIFSVLSLKGSIKWLICGVILVLCGVVFSALAFYKQSNVYLCLSLFSNFLFLLIVIKIALQRVIFSDRINLHNVAGAGCVYLLLGIIWSQAYFFVNVIMPGSFKGNLSLDMQIQSSDFVYYSFVTLTTLGYGDIMPLSATARSLAYMEAIFGQFYIAILVAGLVSIHITNKLREDIEKMN